jgi:hypothetical protein
MNLLNTYIDGSARSSEAAMELNRQGKTAAALDELRSASEAQLKALRIFGINI